MVTSAAPPWRSCARWGAGGLAVEVRGVPSWVYHSPWHPTQLPGSWPFTHGALDDFRLSGQTSHAIPTLAAGFFRDSDLSLTFPWPFRPFFVQNGSRFGEVSRGTKTKRCVCPATGSIHRFIASRSLPFTSPGSRTAVGSTSVESEIRRWEVATSGEKLHIIPRYPGNLLFCADCL